MYDVHCPVYCPVLYTLHMLQMIIIIMCNVYNIQSTGHSDVNDLMNDVHFAENKKLDTSYNTGIAIFLNLISFSLLGISCYSPSTIRFLYSLQRLKTLHFCLNFLKASDYMP